MPKQIHLSDFAPSLKNVSISCKEVDINLDCGDEQALVKVLCASINATDLHSLTGSFGAFQPTTNPKIPGMECVGIIENVGNKVTKVQKGQRVIPILMPELPTKGVGSWQEYIVIDQDRLIIVPDEVSDETAAQFFVNHFNPYALVKMAEIPKDSWVIQSAASGIVGRQILSLAKHFGFNVINLTHHAKQVEELEKYGAQHIINLTDYCKAVLKVIEITQKKLCCAGFDAIGGSIGVIISNCLAESSTMYLYGLMGGKELRLHSHSVLFRDIKAQGFCLVRYLKAKSFEEIVELSNQIMVLLRDKVIDSLPGVKMGFDEIEHALEVAQSPSQLKVLLVPNHTPGSKECDLSGLEEKLDISLSLSDKPE